MEKLPFKETKRSAYYKIAVNGFNEVEIGAVSMGNPHAVVNVDDVKTAPVHKLGALIEKHERFPERVNVGFSQKVSDHEINLRVFERGCGETMACGTGACAAVVAGIVQERLVSPVKVNLPGGSLNISWEGGNSPVLMSGPAVLVYEGQISI